MHSSCKRMFSLFKMKLERDGFLLLVSSFSLFFFFLPPSLPIDLSLMHWVLRDPKESEIVVFRKARIGVMEDGDECGAEQRSSYTRNGWTSSVPSFPCPYFVMVRSIDAVGMQACGVGYPSGDAEDFLVKRRCPSLSAFSSIRKN